MNNLILYLIQVTSVFSLLYTLYVLILSRLTFHKANRLVLLLIIPISIILTFSDAFLPSLSSEIINVPLFDSVIFDTITFETTLNQPLLAEELTLTATSFNYMKLIGTIYCLVLIIYLIRILNIVRQIISVKNNAIIQQKAGYKLVIANVHEIFSYFNWIFIPEHKMEKYDQQIIEHEKAHIKLKHSWDVLLAEVYIALFWFNPLLYFYRKSLKSVHEFQADNGVLQKGNKTSEYMSLLLQSLEIKKPNNLYNYFNQPILKKRVTMMTKTKSNHLEKLKYFLLLPVCVFLILAFNKPVIKENTFLNADAILKIIKTPPSLFPVQNGTIKNITSLFGVQQKHRKINKGKIHGGIDIKGTLGTPILATANGIVSKATLEGNWGNLIIITHADGYQTWYAHLKGFNTSENKVVKKGDIIGYLGNTGLSTGPHLHYEVKKNGKRLNPIDYLK